MKLVNQTEYLARTFGNKRCLEMLKEAGFDAYDMSLFDLMNESCDFYGDDYAQKAAELRKFADSIGLNCVQSHAPFPTYKTDNEEYNSAVLPTMVKALEISSILGAGIMVVHPFQMPEYFENQQWLFENNMAFYRELIPYCERYGVKIAVENMFRSKHDKIYVSVCGTPDEFCRYVDELDSEWVTACLDIGHCALSANTEPESFIRVMSHRIGCLHVHDNDLLHDKHVMPYMGKLEWDKICRAFAEIDYSGNFTFEADHTYNSYPEDMAPHVLKLMYETGRYLINKIEEYKREIQNV